jgi:hypothetical protein
MYSSRCVIKSTRWCWPWNISSWKVAFGINSEMVYRPWSIEHRASDSLVCTERELIRDYTRKAFETTSNLPEASCSIRLWALVRACHPAIFLGWRLPSSVNSQATFRRKISPPYSGLKNKQSKKPTWKHVAGKAVGQPEFRIIRGRGRNSVPVGSPVGQNEIA